MSSKPMPAMDLSHLGGSGYNPLTELMRAIILRAIDDFRTKNGEVKDDAVSYFESEDDEYIFSFLSICRYLGLHPYLVRQEIFQGQGRISTRRRAA